jgi:hypothetical protein
MNIFRASTGTASVLGVDSRKISGKAFASIGYVSENQHLPPWMRVGVFLGYPPSFIPPGTRNSKPSSFRNLIAPGSSGRALLRFGWLAASADFCSACHLQRNG